MPIDLLNAFFAGFINVFTWPAFGLMLVGILLGLVVGLLPGLGGSATLALMLPFVYGMKPVPAMAFLLGMHSVAGTASDITSILFGIPGEASSSATILDGHPMAQKGEAGRAIGAALASSFVGAVFGAFALAASIPIIRPIVLSFASPEMFMLAIIGIVFIATLSGKSIIKGLISGGLGLLLATVGMDPHSSILRYTFGWLYLFDGIDLIPVVIGLFAIPELLDMVLQSKKSIASATGVSPTGGMLEGIKDTFRHFGLVIRCSLIGTIIGALPGLGGSVAQWIAYSHAVQSSGGDPARFGKGAVEGVLGPGACNNSKDGGTLIPTIAFGIPGNVSTAILLGAFLIVGLTPGPSMLTSNLSITFSMVWIIVIANLIAVAICFLFTPVLARLMDVRGTLLAPPLMLLTFLGAFGAHNSMGDIILLVVSGVLGYAMVIFDWSRPPLLVGLVLGGLAEKKLFISVSASGFSWIGRPVVLVLFAIVITVIVCTIRLRFRARRGQSAILSDER